MMVTGSNIIPVIRLADPSFQVEGQLDSHLLVHLSASQISFAIYNSISNSIVAFGVYSITATDEFDEAIAILKADEWAHQPYSHVHLVVQPDDFVLVPKDLFDPIEIGTYLNFHSFKDVGGSQLFDRMESIGVVGVYHLPYSGIEAMGKLYSNLSVFASPTPFIQLAIREFSKHKGDNLLVMFEGKLMHVLVLNQAKLLYYNAFEVDEKNDVSYCSLAICEQLSLSPEKINVFVWGNTDSYDERLDTLKYYFRNVAQGERPLALKYADGLSSLPTFSQYPLFASALCE